MENTRTMLTIKLKLYKPSLRKQMIIDAAVENYTKACQFLLDNAWERLDQIRESCKDDRSGRYFFRAIRLSGWIDNELSTSLNDFQVEPFKDSIRLDVASMLATFFASAEKGMQPDFPKAGQQRPIFFCRYATGRNYCLLYSPETKKYYAKVFLMNAKDEKRESSGSVKSEGLFYVGAEGKEYKDRKRKKSYVMFPLAFGKWQQQYLDMARRDPQMLKTARLVKENGEYYLMINIAVENSVSKATHGYLGVARSIHNYITYTVVGSNGLSLEYNSIAPKETDNNGNRLHRTANELVEVAKRNGSRIIVEKLLERNDGIAYIDKYGQSLEPLFSSKEYNQLCGLLDYKAPLAGLQIPVRVSATGLFFTCPSCGKTAKANRFSADLLICTKCGTAADVERAGSEVLAKRILKYRKDRIQFKVVKQNEEICFVNEELEFYFQPQNPYDCAEEFKLALRQTINAFFENIVLEKGKPGFLKKCSMIKKLDGADADKNEEGLLDGMLDLIETIPEEME